MFPMDCLSFQCYFTGKSVTKAFVSQSISSRLYEIGAHTILKWFNFLLHRFVRSI